MSSAELLQTIMKSPHTSAAIDGSSLATGVSLTVNWPASGAPAVEKRRARRLVETGSSHATTKPPVPIGATAGTSWAAVLVLTATSPLSALPPESYARATIWYVPVPCPLLSHATTNPSDWFTATAGSFRVLVVTVLT